MCEPLPYSDLRFCTPQETRDITREFMQNGGRHLDLEADDGYALECDLSFPPALAEYFDSYPPLADKRCVQRSEYSRFMLQLASEYGLPPSRDEKLVNCLTPKRNYIIHGRNLQFVLSIGVRLDAVHRVAKWKQKRFLAPYIKFNNHQRTLSSDEFSRSFFKLLK